MSTWRGYDHNGECLDCDEHARSHDEACPFWPHVEALQADYTEAVRLYRERDAQAARLHEELVKANEKVESFRASATDFASKLQFLVDWADGQGLLEDHVFTFPDGDVWEAKPIIEPPLQRPEES